jgi:hypothetical protein
MKKIWVSCVLKRIAASVGCLATVSACVPPLLTTNMVTTSNDTIARVRFRLIGDGMLKALQYAASPCHFATDKADRSLAFIVYQAHSLNILQQASPPPKLGMPTDLVDASPLTYAETSVKAGTPLEFGVIWNKRIAYTGYEASRFASFTPEPSADYEVTVTAHVKQSLGLTIDRLEIVDGKVSRVPVSALAVSACKE